jgi:hypothetical protein
MTLSQLEEVEVLGSPWWWTTGQGTPACVALGPKGRLWAATHFKGRALLWPHLRRHKGCPSSFMWGVAGVRSQGPRLEIPRGEGDHLFGVMMPMWETRSRGSKQAGPSDGQPPHPVW